MREQFIKKIAEKLKSDENVMAVLCDLGYHAFDDLRVLYPERVINVGISECAALAFASGLAKKGKKPYIYTITAFGLYRAFEFLRNDACYNRCNIRLVTVGTTLLDYPEYGFSHNSIEAYQVATAIPELVVLSPSDGKETEIMTDWMDTIDAAVWMSVNKQSDYEIHKHHKELKFGKPLLLTEKSDNELAIITTGPITKTVLEVNERLRKDGIRPAVISCPTLKPIDLDGVSGIIERSRLVVVIEENTAGLWNIIARYHSGRQHVAGKVISIAIPDSFEYNFGSKDFMMRQAGLDANSIYLKLKAVINNK